MDYEREQFWPPEDRLRSIEQAGIDIKPSDEKLVEWHKSYLRHHSHRLSFDLDIVARNTELTSSILECGSLPPVLTCSLMQSGYDVTGCDIEPGRYETVIDKLGLKIVKCNIEVEELPFGDNSFDVVIFNELFEHLRINPIFTLSEVRRVLKKNGRLFLSSPNLRSYGGIKNFLFRNECFSCSGNIFAEYQKLEKLGHMGHVREYTTKEVVEFLRHIGLDVRKIIFRGRYGSNVSQAIIRVIPHLSPFVSYVATKSS